MATVRLKGAIWYARWTDETGRPRERALPPDVKRKAHAQIQACDLEAKARKIRDGEIPAAVNVDWTLRDLIGWWLKATASQASAASTAATVRRNLLSEPLADKPAARVTAGDLAAWLRSKEATLAPASRNHLRKFVHAAFALAIREGQFVGVNPAAAVPKAKVPSRKADFLRADEVLPVLDALTDEWRALFAVAIYAGLRRGELFALKVRDVDLPGRRLTVRGSHGRDTPKGGDEGVVPIADELVPYLQGAIDASTSEYLFPAPDGGRRARGTQLEKRLRTALKRAGIVDHFDHVCRRCGAVVRAPDDTRRKCPAGCMALLPVARARPIRFHDLRHTCGSLLANAGVSTAALQKILRHSDPRTTMAIYVHLQPDFLLREVNRLRFHPAGQGPDPDPGAVPPAAEPARAVVNAPTWANPGQDAQPHLRLVTGQGVGPAESLRVSGEAQGEANPQQAAPKAGALPDCATPRAARRMLQTAQPRQPTPTTLASRAGDDSPRSHRLAPVGTSRWANHGQATGGRNGLRPVRDAADVGRMLTVAEVAGRLAVCKATVYRLCAEGALAHVRILDAIRVAVGDLEAFVARGGAGTRQR